MNETYEREAQETLFTIICAGIFIYLMVTMITYYTL